MQALYILFVQLLCLVTGQLVFSNVNTSFCPSYYFASIAPWMNDVNLVPILSGTPILSLSLVTKKETESEESKTASLTLKVGGENVAVVIRDAKTNTVIVYSKDGQIELNQGDEVAIIHPVPEGLDLILNFIGKENFAHNFTTVMTLNKSKPLCVFFATLTFLVTARNQFPQFTIINHKTPLRQEKQDDGIHYLIHRQLSNLMGV